MAAKTQNTDQQATSTSRRTVQPSLIAIVLLVIACVTLGFLYFKEKSSKAKIDETDALVKKVQKLIELPSTEAPTIATVQDKSKLKDQKLFKLAENGDKVLIYATAGKAILYRPSSNKIIEVVPVSVPSPTQVVTPSTKPASPEASLEKDVRIVLLNGTSTVGITKAYEDVIAAKDGFQVTDKDNAAKNTYTTNQVVKIGAVTDAKLKELADLVGGDILNELPEGESKPDADVVIIVGKSL